MKVSFVLDLVEQALLRETGKVLAPEREILLDWCNKEISRLIAELGDPDWAQVWLQPALAVVASQRSYALPEDFGANFVRWGGDEGTDHLCKLSDGTKEQPLLFKSPPQFYSNDMTSTNTGVPECYTITTLPGGRRQLSLHPLPSTAATWTINGLYVPTEYALTEEDELPPFPANCTVLVSCLLRTIYSTPQHKDLDLYALHNSEYMRDYETLIKASTRDRAARLVPGHLAEFAYSGMSDYSGGL